MKTTLTAREYREAIECDDNACLLSNIEKLDVDMIIAGSVELLESKYYISMRLFEGVGGEEIVGINRLESTSGVLDEALESVGSMFLGYLGREPEKKVADTDRAEERHSGESSRKVIRSQKESTAPTGRCAKGNCNNGQGTYTWSNGDNYIGEWKDDKRNGQDTYTSPNGSKYIGELKDNKYNGQGTFAWPDGSKYIGEWKDGKRNGQGTYTSPDGSKYIGELKDNKYNGQGTYTWPNGDNYIGEFKDGKMHGQGTKTWPNGSKYIGEWKDDKQFP